MLDSLTNTAIAGLHACEQINAQRSILVVCGYLLLNLPSIACIGARTIVGECFGAGKFVVTAGCCDDVALRSDLAGEAGDWAGYLWRMVLVVIVGILSSKRSYCESMKFVCSSKHQE